MGFDAMQDHSTSRLGITINKFQGAFILSALMFSVLAFMLALGESASPCNIAHGQTVCNVGDTETFNDVVTFEDQIQLGATPYAGQWGSTIIADDDTDVPPEWWLDVKHVKIANETVSSSTVLQDDDILQHTFTVTPTLLSDPPNQFRRYLVEALLVLNSTTTGDFDFAFSTPTNWDMHGLVITDVSTPAFASFVDGVETTIQTGATASVHKIEAVIDPNTTTGTGTVVLQWAQNSAAGDTTVERGSYIQITELRPDPS